MKIPTGKKVLVSAEVKEECSSLQKKNQCGALLFLFSPRKNKTKQKINLRSGNSIGRCTYHSLKASKYQHSREKNHKHKKTPTMLLSPSVNKSEMN